MNTNFYATKDRPRGVRTDRRHIGGEQYRREMRAALHDLQQRLGQCQNGLSGVRVVVTAGPAPSSTEYGSEENCSRSSAVFTPFLLLVRYFECGQVGKEIGTTFPLALIEGYARGSHLSGCRSDIFYTVRLAHLGDGATVRGVWP